MAGDDDGHAGDGDGKQKGTGEAEENQYQCRQNRSNGHPELAANCEKTYTHCLLFTRQFIDKASAVRMKGGYSDTAYCCHTEYKPIGGHNTRKCETGACQKDTQRHQP